MDKLARKRDYMRSYYKKNREVLLKKKQDFYLANLEEIALSSFDLTKEEEIKAACNYINLQPMWAKDNLSKGSNAL